jgi:flavin reductase (DIM6/NTAB) family NADH-FMN oxidoreductase RutF/DNA-binding GntR family transcriptional regulator
MTGTRPDPGQTQVDPAVFRGVVGHLTSGVSIITTDTPDGPRGMTASSVTSLSMNPPSMLVCLNEAAPTAHAIAAAGSFAINVLDQDSGHLAGRFATPSADKFAGLPTTVGTTGAPLLSEALATIECRTVQEVVAGTHTIFIGHVVGAEARHGDPLTYFRGGFGRFAFARDDAALQQARRLVLDRDLALDAVITVEDLAERLGVDTAAAFYALTRLTAEGLVDRDPQRGHVVAPVDVRVSDAAFDARCLIELGVAATTVGRVSPHALAELRATFEAMAGQLVHDRFVDFDRYLDANQAFHEGIVALADNARVLEAFRQLALRNVMARSFGATDESSQLFLDSQQAILEGYEREDGEAVAGAVRRYTELAKQRAREILASFGGRV